MTATTDERTVWIMTEKLAVFEAKLVELGVGYDVETVDKTDPKTKKIIWSADVAFPKTVEGFVELMGDERVKAFLIDKTKIWLRSQNDPRKVSSAAEKLDAYAQSQGFDTMADMIEAARGAKAAKVKGV